jgi:hypothetical protein
VFEEEPDPVEVRRQTEQDSWAAQFNGIKRSAPIAMPDQYKRHYFTEQEEQTLRAGRPQTVVLMDDDDNFYRAQVKWTGTEFTEVKVDF